MGYVTTLISVFFQPVDERVLQNLFKGLGELGSVAEAQWEIFLCARLEKYVECLAEIEESGLLLFFFFKFKILFTFNVLPSEFFSFFRKKYLIFWLWWVLAVAFGIFSCSVWYLVRWPGIKPQPPALGAWSLSHWTTRKVPGHVKFEGLMALPSRGN